MKPKPANPKSNDSILAAVRAAKREVIPRAVADARNRAQLLADAAGLTLGALVGVADTSSNGPFFYSPYGQEGTFEPGKFCGTVNRYRTTRKNGVFRRKLIGKSRRCRVPSQITASETVIFTTAP